MKITFKTKIGTALLILAVIIFDMVPIYLVGTYLDNVHHTHTKHYVLEGIDETYDCWKANCNFVDVNIFTNN